MGKGGAHRRLPSLAVPRPQLAAAVKVALPQRLDPGQVVPFEVAGPICVRHGPADRATVRLNLLHGPEGRSLYVLINGHAASPLEMAMGAWCDSPECHLIAIGEALLSEPVPASYPRTDFWKGAVGRQRTGAGTDRDDVLLAIRFDTERGIAVGSYPPGRTVGRIDLGRSDRPCTCPVGHLTTCFHRDLLARIPATESLAAELTAVAVQDTYRLNGLTRRGTAMGEVLNTAKGIGDGLCVHARLEPPVEGISALRTYIRSERLRGIHGDLDESIVLMEGDRAVACETCDDDECADLRLARALLEAKAKGTAPLRGTETFDENDRL